VRISKVFDLMTHHSQSMFDNEFILVKFKDIDNEVCITKHYIFDSSNVSAICFSAEAINGLVLGPYSGIEMGLYINKRTETVGNWLCKFNSDGMLQSANINICHKFSKYVYLFLGFFIRT
jgi:hypothetical protein